MSRPAVFFDRDGTLSHEIGYVNHISRFEPFAFAVDAIRAVNAGNRLAVIVTNQAGIGKGLMTEKQLQKVHAHMMKTYGIENEFIPCWSVVLRLWIRPQAMVSFCFIPRESSPGSSSFLSAISSSARIGWARSSQSVTP